MGSSDREDRLREELELHVELETEANLRRGMSPGEARRAALIAFGPAEHHKDDARDQFRSAALAGLAQDIRYAWRGARRSPLLTMVAVATLAGALGLVTAAFTAVNSILLRSLPYPEPDRIALIWGTAAGKTDQLPVSYTNAMDWRRDTKALAGLATFACWPRPILTIRDDAKRVSMMGVSEDFFRVLPARPFLGRLFNASDFVGTASDGVILTYPLWRDRFASDSSVVGRLVQVSGISATIIGVLSADYPALPQSLGCRPELYRPLDSQYRDAERGWTFLKAIARLRPGPSLAQAQAELDGENHRLAERFPETNGGHGATIVAMHDYLTRPLRPVLAFALIVTGLLLLIAAANVASLLLARATVRRREMAIRAALGASQRRLARQILTECLLLGCLAGGLGTVVSVAGSGLIGRLGGEVVPAALGPLIDWRVIVAGVLSCLIVTAALGLAAVTASRGESSMGSFLRDGARGNTRSGAILRRAIVAAQLSLATMVLIGAGLMARSYRRLRDIDPGFDPSGVLSARVALPQALYPRGSRDILFFRQVLDRLRAQPGVVAAGAVSILPESANFDHTNVRALGRAYAPGEEPSPDVYRVTPGYFEAMRIRLVSGRLFTADDDDHHPLVAVINETMARRLFPDGKALGRRLWTGTGNAERTVVGVVGDVYQYGLESAKTLQLYVPHADNGGTDLTIVLRTAEEPAGMVAAVTEAVRAIDPGIPVDEVLTMDQVLASSAARRRLLAGYSLAFAVAAIGLALIGLYGVAAYAVAQQNQEIGVRMALGATGRRIIAMVIGDTWTIVLPGLGIGWLGAAALARLMTPLVFGVPVTDAVTFLVAPAAMSMVALVATLVPALRATTISPVEVLRRD